MEGSYEASLPKKSNARVDALTFSSLIEASARYVNSF